MNTPSLILIGAKHNQVQKMEAIAFEENWQTRHYPDIAGIRLEDAKLLGNSALTMLFHHRDIKKTRDQFFYIKGNFPQVPVIVVGKQPSRLEIIQLFRMGIQDLLLWSSVEKESQQLFKQYRPSRSRWNLFQPVEWVVENVRRQFQRENRPDDNKWDRLGISAGLPSLHMSNPLGQVRAPDLKIRFFQELCIEFKGKKVRKIPGKKIGSILAYLLYYHHQPIHREKLMALFWGERSPSSANNSLNVAIYTIRKHFQSVFPEQEIILYRNDSYVINPELDISSDSGLFMDYWQKARSIEVSQGLEAAIGVYNKALALYRGDFLENMLYEEWCEAERDNLKEIYLLMLERSSTYFFNEGLYTASINICRKILAKDPCLEYSYRRLIICYDRLGLRDKAIRQFQKCARILSEELGVEPSEETKRIFVEISEG